MSYNVNNPPESEHDNFIGKRVVHARIAGVNFRVTKRDGDPAIVTQDCNFSRYNFEVEHGVITKQWMG